MMQLPVTIYSNYFNYYMAFGVLHVNYGSVSARIMMQVKEPIALPKALQQTHQLNHHTFGNGIFSASHSTRYSI